ncbi:CPBP family intramembrane glutamic endopeptidase [Acidipropionibacterium timonense]|uniref:CPBP family intramembrane glutamic endopeptidase n=1 Tax=Acidipropionibacterium timonense TaxID=2161818 RepID=UPI0010303DC6|nr:CPBP family intramembrane glutamic endopeptidase [Acidipropionibacterium timonense]
MTAGGTPSGRRPGSRTTPAGRRPAPGEYLEPQPGVDYAHVLASSPDGVVRGLLGLAGAMLGWALLVPVVVQLLIVVGWLVTGMPGTLAEHTARATRFETVDGLVATHLGLACLIVVVLALARWVHHRRARWVWSVQPGMRWRYGLIVAVVAAVVINLTQVLVKGDAAWHFTTPRDWWVWILAIVLTSPLQAAAEEVFFRGYLMNALGSMGAGRWVAVIVSALVFALAHGTQSLWLFLDRFAFGVIAGSLVIVTGGLEAGIGAHVVNNLFAFGYSVFQGGAARARGITTMAWQDAVWDVVGFATIAAAAMWIGAGMNLARTTPGKPVDLPKGSSA